MTSISNCVQLALVLLAIVQLSNSFTLPDFAASGGSQSDTSISSHSSTTDETPTAHNYCSHSSCGWEIKKRSFEIVYVDSGCICRPNELCIRTHNDYRLPGFKYHCRVVEAARLPEVVLFPNRTDIGKNGFFKYYP